MSDDTPIEPQDYRYGVTVVDIGEARVKRGMTRRPYSSCRHHALHYDPKERRIWCADCETEVQAFDAFVILVENFHSAASMIEAARTEIKTARTANIHLIAARQMEKYWRRRNSVPACPHCHAGLLPEDVDRMGSVSREIEVARRGRKSRD